MVEEREVEAVADGDEDMVVAVGDEDEKMVLEGQCGKEGADDKVGLEMEKGEDVDGTVVGKRGRSQQRQPF